MHEVLIRKFEERDSAQLIERVRELQAHECELDRHMKAPNEIGPWYLEQLMEACAEHSGTVFVAETSDKMVGYACVLCNTKCTDPDEKEYVYALLSEIGVTPEVRGKGVGRRLMEACRDEARSQGAKHFRIGVLAENRDALRLYEGFGFKQRTIELEMDL